MNTPFINISQRTPVRLITQFESFDVDSSEATWQINQVNLKKEVAAATTTNGNLTSDFENGDIIDGVTLSTNDRILIKDQTDAEQNGIYVVQETGAPLRAGDLNSSEELLRAVIKIKSGIINVDKYFIVTTDTINEFVLETNDLIFSELPNPSSLNWKQSVRVATVTNGTLASSFAKDQVIDGVTLKTNDRILIKDQTAAAENGIYVVQNSGAPVRADDVDSAEKLNAAAVFVNEGTNSNKTFVVLTDTLSNFNLNTNNLSWFDFTFNVINDNSQSNWVNYEHIPNVIDRNNTFFIRAKTFGQTQRTIDGVPQFIYSGNALTDGTGLPILDEDDLGLLYYAMNTNTLSIKIKEVANLQVPTLPFYIRIDNEVVRATARTQILSDPLDVYTYSLDKRGALVTVATAHTGGKKVFIGTPLYVTDGTGEPYLDDNGDPIYQVDSNGDLILDDNGNPIPLTDGTGLPVLDGAGNPILLRDGTGLPLLDENGNAIYEFQSPIMDDVESDWSDVLTSTQWIGLQTVPHITKYGASVSRISVQIDNLIAGVDFAQARFQFSTDPDFLDSTQIVYDTIAIGNVSVGGFEYRVPRENRRTTHYIRAKAIEIPDFYYDAATQSNLPFIVESEWSTTLEVEGSDQVFDVDVSSISADKIETGSLDAEVTVVNGFLQVGDSVRGKVVMDSAGVAWFPPNNEVASIVLPTKSQTDNTPVYATFKGVSIEAPGGLIATNPQILGTAGVITNESSLKLSKGVPNAPGIGPTLQETWPIATTLPSSDTPITTIATASTSDDFWITRGNSALKIGSNGTIKTTLNLKSKPWSTTTSGPYSGIDKLYYFPEIDRWAARKTEDGLTGLVWWTYSGITVPSSNSGAIFYSNIMDAFYSVDENVLVTVGSDGIRSANPLVLSWTIRNSTGSFRSITRKPGVVSTDVKWVAVGNSGLIRTASSISGSWSTRTSNTTNALNAVKYANGRFLAVGNAGTVRYSNDGITWYNSTVYFDFDPLATGITTPSTANFYNITFISSTDYPNGVWMITGDYNAVKFSTDNGQTFRQIASLGNLSTSSSAERPSSDSQGPYLKFDCCSSNNEKLFLITSKSEGLFKFVYNDLAILSNADTNTSLGYKINFDPNDLTNVIGASNCVRSEEKDIWLTSTGYPVDGINTILMWNNNLFIGFDSNTASVGIAEANNSLYLYDAFKMVKTVSTSDTSTLIETTNSPKVYFKNPLILFQNNQILTLSSTGSSSSTRLRLSKLNAETLVFETHLPLTESDGITPFYAGSGTAGGFVYDTVNSCYAVSLNTRATPNSSIPARSGVYCFDINGKRLPNLEFKSSTGAAPSAMIYRNNRYYTLSSNTSNILYQHSQFHPGTAATRTWARFNYVSSNSQYQTEESPASDILISARAFVSVRVPGIPAGASKVKIFIRGNENDNTTNTNSYQKIYEGSSLITTFGDVDYTQNYDVNLTQIGPWGGTAETAASIYSESPGWALLGSGLIRLDQYPTSSPSSPEANQAFLFLRTVTVNEVSKQQVCVKFAGSNDPVVIAEI